MASPHTTKPASGDGARRVSKAVLLGGSNGSNNTDTDDKAQAELPLIDRHGRRHSEAVLTSWSAAAIRALGIRRADGSAL